MGPGGKLLAERALCALPDGLLTRPDCTRSVLHTHQLYALTFPSLNHMPLSHMQKTRRADGREPRAELDQQGKKRKIPFKGSMQTLPLRTLTQRGCAENHVTISTSNFSHAIRKEPVLSSHSIIFRITD